MKTILTAKILRKMLVLGVLLAGLGFFVSTNSPARAAKTECCADCVPFFELCQEMCNSEAHYPGCEMVCYHALWDCWDTCTECP